MIWWVLIAAVALWALCKIAIWEENWRDRYSDDSFPGVAAFFLITIILAVL